MEKPSKGDIALWAQSDAGRYFLTELVKRFPVAPASTRYLTLDDHAAMASRAEILEWISRFMNLTGR